ncbi:MULTISPECIES: hypothetical protein [Amycolatopsis]|uniref:Uncharacterized protein n=1 Tax=Amycolatopsis thermalba TaxID=944492 RepID=A0ABY4NU26_9PSEU|nr:MULTISPECIES: hypothetical protein [Amycolatopsis]UQS23572.1 hypothetical protein L1857_12435 [Amycolatopsis thermalba]
MTRELRWIGGPAMIAAPLSLLAGMLLLCPAVLAFAARAGTGWGACGAVLVVTRLFGRVCHAGFDQAALARHRGAGFVGDAYGDPHLFSYLTFTILLGWPVLAFAAWRARVLHPVQALGLAATAALPLGVLKGTTALSLVAVAGLGVALVPEGSACSAPRRGRTSGWWPPRCRSWGCSRT